MQSVKEVLAQLQIMVDKGYGDKTLFVKQSAASMLCQNGVAPVEGVYLDADGDVLLKGQWPTTKSLDGSILVTLPKSEDN